LRSKIVQCNLALFYGQSPVLIPHHYYSMGENHRMYILFAVKNQMVK